MVVDEHLATLREAGQRQHLPHIAPRDDAGGLHDPVVVHGANEADLAAVGEANGGFDGLRCFGGESVARHDTIYRTNAVNRRA